MDDVRGLHHDVLIGDGESVVDVRHWRAGGGRLLRICSLRVR